MGIYDIAEFCRKSLPEGLYYIINELYSNIRYSFTHKYSIEISDVCNLKCPTCVNAYREGGGHSDEPFMKKEKFVQIIEKISKHSVLKKIIELYNWGEPLLHPEVDDFVRIAKAKGFIVWLSSNLNNADNLEKAIKEEPDLFCVSVSGFNQDNYKITHAGGNIELVKENMKKLREYKNKYNSKTTVLVAFHIYKHNVEDMKKMYKFSKSLKFIFLPYLASANVGITQLLAHLYKAVPLVNDINEYLLIQPRSILEHMQTRRHRTNYCRLRNKNTAINSDGTLDICCGTKRELLSDKPFLELPLKEIEHLKFKHPLCKTCLANGLPDFSNYNISGIRKMRANALQQYLDITNFNHIYDYLEKSTVSTDIIDDNRKHLG